MRTALNSCPRKNYIKILSWCLFHCQRVISKAALSHCCRGGGCRRLCFMRLTCWLWIAFAFSTKGVGPICVSRTSRQMTHPRHRLLTDHPKWAEKSNYPGSQSSLLRQMAKEPCCQKTKIKHQTRAFQNPLWSWKCKWGERIHLLAFNMSVAQVSFLFLVWSTTAIFLAVKVEFR